MTAMTDTLTEDTATQALSTAPASLPTRNRVRSLWRSLTSMRTALLLLSLLALAAVPGTLLPQRGLNPVKVDDFFTAHPSLAPFLDKLSLFDVFAAPWFAAIYLLLFVSLIGCLVPRIRLHARALRRKPPNAPKRLERLAIHDTWDADGDAEKVAAAARESLKRQRWRTTELRQEPGGAWSFGAEKGYLRETGNLVFHVALVVLLTGIALGGLFGYKGTVLIADGGSFSDVPSSYDVFTPARLGSESALPPFAFTLRKFTASYQPNGEPKSFHAYVDYRSTPDAPSRPYDVTTNHPLSIAGTDIYLVGHGYAVHVQVRDKAGHLVYDKATPFLPDDSMFTSHGVVKVPAGLPNPLGFTGFFYPTYEPTPFGAQSSYPGPAAPVLSLAAWQGDLGLSSGRPQSVYSLPVASLKNVGTKTLGPGQTWKLADGTTVTFAGLDQWATFQIAHDPGSTVVLVAAVFIVCGLLSSLWVRRRRMWVRAVPGARRTVVSAGGLARTDADGFATEFESLLRRMKG
ncbi:MAG: cytochrome c biogenesis protein ResB [Frankiales bacterium]|nr:cytochrome c biogenesis protein ResB [Frankiales bacterium]